jgi:hypothetical protein
VSIDIGKLLADAERRAGAGARGSGFGFGNLFKPGAPTEQLLVWGLLNQLLGTVLAPELQELQRGVYKLLQSVPLTPPMLADMVVRHIVPMDKATDYAKQSGTAPSDFQRMVQSAGEGLAPGDLAEALRRGLIPESGVGPDAVSFQQGMAEAHTRDKWAPIVKGLSVREPTPADALDALLEGQLEEDRARELYVRFGGDPEHFTWLFDTRGTAPTPLEAADMANRGIIPWDGTGPDATSFHQAMLEGPSRNKWFGPYRQFAAYHPPARTIVAMVRAGALSDDAALRFFHQLGMDDELAAAQLTDAHHQKVAAERSLTVSQVKALYQDRFIDASQATAMLALLRYTTDDAGFLIDVWEFEVQQSQVRSAIAKVRALYVAHKIDAAAASRTMDGLGVPAAGRDYNLSVWTLERDANVVTLTAAEIADAVFYSLLTEADGVARLVALGWQQDDAALRIGIRLHGKPPPAPKP